MRMPRCPSVLVLRQAQDEGNVWLGTFDRLAGTDRLRLGIEAGLGIEALTAGWAADLAAFEARRAPHLLY